MYIEQINGPEDVKKLNIEEMTAMAAERTFWTEFWYGRSNDCDALCI